MNWPLFLGLFLVAWFLQNVLHEASHLLVGWIVEGRKPKKLIPWMHKHEGRFYFARYECGETTKEGSASWRHFSPVILGVLGIVIVIWFMAIFSRSPYLMPFISVLVVDELVWLWGFFTQREGTDGEQFTQSLIGRL